MNQLQINQQTSEDPILILNNVKYLHSINKDCTEYAMDWASENGHLEVVKYLHSINKDCTIS